jgi:hypothetical protein
MQPCERFSNNNRLKKDQKIRLQKAELNHWLPLCASGIAGVSKS